MRIDDAIKEAFEREVSGVPRRFPGAAEISRACGVHASSPRSGRAGLLRSWMGDFVPVLAMAAAAAVALCLDPAAMRFVRPLASELVISLPDDAGSRFVDFVLEAGESYRSLD